MRFSISSLSVTCPVLYKLPTDVDSGTQKRHSRINKATSVHQLIKLCQHSLIGPSAAVLTKRSLKMSIWMVDHFQSNLFQLLFALNLKPERRIDVSLFVFYDTVTKQ